MGHDFEPPIYQRRGAIRSAHVREPAPEVDRTVAADLDEILARLNLAAR